MGVENGSKVESKRGTKRRQLLQKTFDDPVKRWKKSADPIWSCPRCTFHNSQTNTICEMCEYAPPPAQKKKTLGNNAGRPQKKQKRRPPTVSSTSSEGTASRRPRNLSAWLTQTIGKSRISNNNSQSSASSSSPSHQQDGSTAGSSRSQDTKGAASRTNSYSSVLWKNDTKEIISLPMDEQRGDPGVSAHHSESEMWTSKYEPTSAEELCLHPRKIAEVRGWMQNAQKIGQTFLLLTGPPGCGKSTLVSVLAKELGYDLSSWTEDTDAANGFMRLADHSDHYRTSKMESFKQFLLHGRYSSLGISFSMSTGSSHRARQQIRSRKQVILLDELPYTGKPYLRAQFQSVIREAIDSSKSMMIMVATDDHENSSKIEYLLGAPTLTHPRVGHITCRAVNATCLTRALNRIADGEGLALAKHTCRDIVSSCKGDLRNAILTLQLRSVPKEFVGNIMASTSSGYSSASHHGRRNRKRTRSKNQTREVGARTNSEVLGQGFGGRDDTFQIWHALGKILYEKKEMSPEDVVASSDVTPERFAEFLQWNCLGHLLRSGDEKGAAADGRIELEDFADELGPACAVLEDMSTADALAAGKRSNYGNSVCPVDEGYVSSVACRGYLLGKASHREATDGSGGGKMSQSQSSKPKKRLLKTTAPKANKQFWDTKRKLEEIRATFANTDVCSSHSTTEVVVDVLPFIGRIGMSALDMTTQQIQLVCQLNRYKELNRPRPFWGEHGALGGWNDGEGEIDEEELAKELASAAVLHDDDIQEFSD